MAWFGSNRETFQYNIKIKFHEFSNDPPQKEKDRDKDKDRHIIMSQNGQNVPEDFNAKNRLL